MNHTSGTSLPLLTWLRVVVLVGLGIPVISGLFSGVLTWVIESHRLDVPSSSADRFGAWAFGGLSFVFLALCLRASFRVWRGEQSVNRTLTWILRLTPITFVAGTIAGVMFVSGVVKEQDAGLIDDARADCAVTLGSPEAVTDACIEAARSCHRQRVEDPSTLPRPDLAELNAMPDTFRSRDRENRAEAFCLMRAMDVQLAVEPAAEDRP